ncbi:MAG: type II secretion system protein [Gallionella sp.]|nr:type II secretion system protein [Gallionella sp.]
MSTFINRRFLDDQRGFSLIEMAIVMTIIGLLLAGMIPTITTQMEQQKRTETRKQMDEIISALLGYAITQGKLPCPASPIIATGNVGAGVSNGAPGTCTNNPGVLPWATLGIAETDAWGRRFTYSVTNSYTDSTTLTLSSTGDRAVLSASGGVYIASAVPAVIVSHGTNGYGAYSPNGTQIAGASGDESDNSDTDTTYVSHEFAQNGFDDLLIWLSPNTLNNRMVAAGKLP